MSHYSYLLPSILGDLGEQISGEILTYFDSNKLNGFPSSRADEKWTDASTSTSISHRTAVWLNREMSYFYMFTFIKLKMPRLILVSDPTNTAANAKTETWWIIQIWIHRLCWLADWKTKLVVIMETLIKQFGFCFFKAYDLIYGNC